jgi:hypothetical protein
MAVLDSKQCEDLCDRATYGHQKQPECFPKKSLSLRLVFIAKDFPLKAVFRDFRLKFCYFLCPAAATILA